MYCCGPLRAGQQDFRLWKKCVTRYRGSFGHPNNLERKERKTLRAGRVRYLERRCEDLEGCMGKIAEKEDWGKLMAFGVEK